MRLSPDQTRVILQCVRQQFGVDAGVMLFGSRLDDGARGGDIDLLVESAPKAAALRRPPPRGGGETLGAARRLFLMSLSPPTLMQRARATMALETALNLPVDFVATQRGTPGSAFARIARSRAQSLEVPCRQANSVAPATADFEPEFRRACDATDAGADHRGPQLRQAGQ